MNVNDIVYVILNGSIVAQAKILKKSGNLYTIRLSNDKVLRLPEHRLFKEQEDAIKKYANSCKK